MEYSHYDLAGCCEENKMKPLRKELIGRFCECCGRANTEVWDELSKGVPHLGIHVWEGHEAREDTDKFTDNCILRYCECCGSLLGSDAIHFHLEAQPWGDDVANEVIVDGYTCHCGYHKED
jgi:hypothetical protein